MGGKGKRDDDRIEADQAGAEQLEKRSEVKIRADYCGPSEAGRGLE